MTMSRLSGRFGLLVALAPLLVAGCGGESRQGAATIASPAGQASHQPAAAGAAKDAARGAAAKEPEAKIASSPRKTGISNLFLAPEIPEEFLAPKEDPKPDETAAKRVERPRIRLLGFSNVDGFKALVEVKGEIFAVSQGDIVGGAQVVSVEAPSVTFEFASSRWGTRLFDQPWHNEQTSTVASKSGSSRAFAAQRRSGATAHAFVGARPEVSTGSAAPLLGPAGPAPMIGGLPAIPGMPASDNALPGGPAASSTPGMGIGGLPGYAGSAPAAPPGGITTPSMPGGITAPGGGIAPGGAGGGPTPPGGVDD